MAKNAQIKTNSSVGSIACLKAWAHKVKNPGEVFYIFAKSPGVQEPMVLDKIPMEFMIIYHALFLQDF
jgi:hypothetical protein